MLVTMAELGSGFCPTWSFRDPRPSHPCFYHLLWSQIPPQNYLADGGIEHKGKHRSARSQSIMAAYNPMTRSQSHNHMSLQGILGNMVQLCPQRERRWNLVNCLNLHLKWPHLYVKEINKSTPKGVAQAQTYLLI